MISESRLFVLKQGASACLQVMGAHLSSLRGHEHEQGRWREALEILQSTEEPSEEERLFAILCISYEALGHAQSCMFLDAAFVLPGTPRRYRGARLARVRLKFVISNSA